MDLAILTLAEGQQALALFIACVGIACAYALYTCIKHMLLIFRMQTFATTTGRVLVSRVEQRMVRHRNKDSILYVPILEYEFEANGRNYRGNTMSFQFDYSSTSDAIAGKVQNDFPRGSRPTVYYNPDKPTESCLIASHLGPKFFGFAIGALASVVGMILSPIFAWYLWHG